MQALKCFVQRLLWFLWNVVCHHSHLHLIHLEEQGLVF